VHRVSHGQWSQKKKRRYYPQGRASAATGWYGCAGEEKTTTTRKEKKETSRVFRENDGLNLPSPSDKKARKGKDRLREKKRDAASACTQNRSTTDEGEKRSQKCVPTFDDTTRRAKNSKRRNERKSSTISCASIGEQKKTSKKRHRWSDSTARLRIV